MALLVCAALDVARWRRCPSPAPVRRRTAAETNLGRRLYGSGPAAPPALVARHRTGRCLLRNCRVACMPGTPAAVADDNDWDEFRQAQRADGPATVLAIGTANPVNCVPQDEYPDYYFRVTNSEHLTQLKAKMKRICDKSRIKKRYFHHTEQLLLDHPELLDREQPSLDTRLGLVAGAVPELGAAAAKKAIDEWGRPASEITHLVVGTYSGAHMPGPDLRISSLLGLRSSVRRTMLYYHGCSAGSSALRVAKDIAENNRGARVLVVCAELTVVAFRAPDQAHLDTLVIQSLFGDGAGAVIVGADPQVDAGESPVFEVLAVAQSVIPGTERAASSQFGKGGLDYSLSSTMPALIGDNIERCLVDELAPLGIGGGGGWNNLFWAVHPGGPAILDSYEAALRLEPGKLAASRHVLSEYGNMSGVTTIFVLDELRRRRDEDGGIGGSDRGVVVGLGPGVTVEMMALHACKTTTGV